MPDSRVGLGFHQPRNPDAALDAHLAEVVAYQVDDHHVLGPVLGRALERAALQRGALRLGRPAVGSLDGPGCHGCARPAQEELGGHARYRALRQAQERRVGRIQECHGTAERVQRVTVEPGFQPHADVRLEQVALPDVLDGAADSRLMLGLSRRRAEIAAAVIA